MREQEIKDGPHSQVNSPQVLEIKDEFHSSEQTSLLHSFRIGETYHL